MNWVPQFVDRDVTFLFSMDVWRIVFVVMFVLLMCTQQIVALSVALAVGYLLQKVETTKSPGFIRHWYYANLGWQIKGFPKNPKKNRNTRI